jgi:hypothetical protein
MLKTELVALLIISNELFEHVSLFLQLQLSFPDATEVSDHAKDLLQNLLCSRNKRLGKRGLDDFKKHPFFASIDWDNLSQSHN